MNIKIEEKVDEKNWNKNILKSEYSTIYQTSYYGDYLKTINCKPYYLSVQDGKDLVGQLLFYRDSYFKGVMRSLFNVSGIVSLKDFYNWEQGPIITGLNQKEILKIILKQMINLSKSSKMDIRSFGFHPLYIPNIELMRNEFRMKKWATFIIDLSMDTEKLWSDINKSARKKVKKAMKTGIVIEEVKEEANYAQYYKVQCENRRRNGLSLHPYNYKGFEILMRNNVLKLLVAKENDKIIAGMFISTYNGYIGQWLTSISDYAIKKNIPVGDLIKWYVIDWGKKNGYRYYDMTGFNPNPKIEKERGILEFKSKWGGKYEEYYNYSKIISSNQDKLLNFLKKICQVKVGWSKQKG